MRHFRSILVLWNS